MSPEALALSADLADQLEQNSAVDPKSIPVRFSHLKKIAQSPAHALHAMQFDSEQTLAMRLGSATHSLSFGGPPVVIYPGKQRRRGVKEYDAFVAANPGAIIVNRKEFRRAQAMTRALRTNPVSARVLFGPGFIYEQTILWEQRGRSRRSTPDVRSFRHVAELKTCRNAEPEKFMWDALRAGYHAQVADQASAIEFEQGFPIKDAYIVAIESVPPHAVVVRHLTSHALEVGARLVNGWLDRFLTCEQANHWPGYAEEVIELDAPIEPVDLIFADDDAPGEEADQ